MLPKTGLARSEWSKKTLRKTGNGGDRLYDDISTSSYEEVTLPCNSQQSPANSDYEEFLPFRRRSLSENSHIKTKNRFSAALESKVLNGLRLGNRKGHKLLSQGNKSSSKLYDNSRSLSRNAVPFGGSLNPPSNNFVTRSTENLPQSSAIRDNMSRSAEDIHGDRSSRGATFSTSSNVYNYLHQTCSKPKRHNYDTINFEPCNPQLSGARSHSRTLAIGSSSQNCSSGEDEDEKLVRDNPLYGDVNAEIIARTTARDTPRTTWKRPGYHAKKQDSKPLIPKPKLIRKPLNFGGICNKVVNPVDSYSQDSEEEPIFGEIDRFSPLTKSSNYSYAKDPVEKEPHYIYHFTSTLAKEENVYDL